MFADVKGPSFVFWPVGCGDSTTVVISDSEVLQIDLDDTAIAEAEDNENSFSGRVSREAPSKGRQALSFLLRPHPSGRGPLPWFRRPAEACDYRRIVAHPARFPRIPQRSVPGRQGLPQGSQAARRRDHQGRRRPGAGHRVRVVGYDDLLKEDDYKGFPLAFFTTPGQSVTMLDGADISTRFAAFVHAPFRNDSAGSRNETSLAMQVVIGGGKSTMSGLFFGDLAYPTLRKVFDETKKHDNLPKLNWNALLAPHHCSKKAMYEKDADGNDVLKQDILDDLDARQASPGFIVASSVAIPGSNTSGDNPPHAKARNRYSEIVNDDFICTGEYSKLENMRPVIYTVTDKGVAQVGKDYTLAEATKEDLAKAIAAVRGSSTPPAGKVGFGRG